MRVREFFHWLRLGSAAEQVEDVAPTGPDGQPRNEAQREAIKNVIRNHATQRARAVLANFDAFDEMERGYRRARSQ